MTECIPRNEMVLIKIVSKQKTIKTLQASRLPEDEMNLFAQLFVGSQAQDCDFETFPELATIP